VANEAMSMKLPTAFRATKSWVWSGEGASARVTPPTSSARKSSICWIMML